ncbi:uncharacterized protein LOC117193678 [Drosophila miranda]|uniref:uncharacterized protein LOC117193678 n=1 Tax=Drosophila miranda TaxID=7229 RepID=UPI00143F3EAC|nr:uncharacterized protein LOC117193678 [Drosophila miranda]
MADGSQFTIPPFPSNETINPHAYHSRNVSKSSCPGLSSSIWMVLGGMFLAARMLWLTLPSTKPKQIDQLGLRTGVGERAEVDRRIHNLRSKRWHRNRHFLRFKQPNNRRIHMDYSQPRYLPR